MDLATVFAIITYMTTIVFSLIFIFVVSLRGRITPLRAGFMGFFITVVVSAVSLLVLIFFEISKATQVFMHIYLITAPLIGGFLQYISLYVILEDNKYRNRVLFIPVLMAGMIGVLRTGLATQANMLNTDTGIELINLPLAVIYYIYVGVFNTLALVCLIYGTLKSRGLVAKRNKILTIFYAVGSLFTVFAIFATRYNSSLAMRYVASGIIAISYSILEVRSYYLDLDELRYRLTYKNAVLPTLFITKDYGEISHNSYLDIFLQSWPKSPLSLESFVNELKTILHPEKLPSAEAMFSLEVHPPAPSDSRNILILVTPLQSIEEYSFIFFDLELENEKYKQQQDLFRNLVHDFRHPLLTISGALDLVEEKLELSHNSELTRLIHMSKDAAIQAENMLVYFLKMSLRGSQIEYYPEKIDPIKELHRIVLNYQPLFNSKNQVLNIAPIIAPKRIAIEVIYSDFYRVVTNLLSNAHIHTPPETTVEVGGEVDGDYFEFWIKDSGPGMERSFVDDIFSKQSKNEKNIPKKDESESFGLGLYSIKYLVQRNRGTIKYGQNDWKGSIFFVRFNLVKRTDSS